MTWEGRVVAAPCPQEVGLFDMLRRNEQTVVCSAQANIASVGGFVRGMPVGRHRTFCTCLCDGRDLSRAHAHTHTHVLNLSTSHMFAPTCTRRRTILAPQHALGRDKMESACEHAGWTQTMRCLLSTAKEGTLAMAILGGTGWFCTHKRLY